MFAGAGGSGVKDMPSSHSKAMPRKCVTCHMHKAKEVEPQHEVSPSKKGGHTFRSDSRACLKCHENPGNLVAEWQSKISPLVERLEVALEAAPDKNSKSYRTARLNYNIVIADGGTGMHNPRYARALLLYSIASLEAGSLWKR